MNSFRVSKAIKQPQRLVRLASTGSLKDKTIGVIGMGHVGKYFLGASVKLGNKELFGHHKIVH